MKQAVELVGRHPLVTGILAITGLLGFVFSIYTYEADRQSAVENSQQTERNISAINKVDQGVKAISAATFASCARAPCWTLEDLVSRDTIGKPKDLVDAKVAPAMRKDKGQFIYELDGCFVSVEYTDDAVSYISANLFKHVEIAGRKDQYGYPLQERKPCAFSIVRLLAPDERPAQVDNANLTVADAIRLISPSADCAGCDGPALQISSACIDCGNYAEPYIEFMKAGSHAEMFIDSFFTTAFDTVDDTGEQGADILAAFRESMRAKIGPDAEYGIEIAPLCQLDIYPEIKRILARSQITAVGLGTGPRRWTNALFCKWWE
ncbi:hypothetical protein N5D48_16115 [Pseudomonas sp. GD03858]|uniref:hypothetical protein n=1 Tax=unclassified Pseudomonas TaxID=196821 RepID=UPI002447AA7C|nr:MULTISPECIES: hypothetical protein [unclassified Pseudomonas]MDH0645395.1 hypothetical protein [Pseudomonas sp. GD03867]MDH0663937.1 hypothetical protein [Pseudomonas sp. GD03858]